MVTMVVVKKSYCYSKFDLEYNETLELFLFYLKSQPLVEIFSDSFEPDAASDEQNTSKHFLLDFVRAAGLDALADGNVEW